MRFHSLDEASSLALSTAAVLSWIVDGELLDENLFSLVEILDAGDDPHVIDGLDGEWIFDRCTGAGRHTWVVRTDIDPWHIEGHRIDTCEPCAACIQKQRDIAAVARLKPKLIIDDVEWILQGSKHDGSPEYVSELGWLGRPFAFNRKSVKKPWICGLPGEDPLNRTFKTIRAAANTLRRRSRCECCGRLHD
jgi:hypothetical protein